MVIERVLLPTGGGAVLAQREGSSVTARVEGLDHPGINHGSSSPPRATKISLMKNKDQGSDPSGKILMRIPSKVSLTGLKKRDLNNGNMTDLEVWTATYRGRTLTLKCPVRGRMDGALRKPITWPL